jgi:hypothetical protein
MKALTKFFAVLFAVGIVAYGCKPERSVEPNKSGSPDVNLTSSGGHDRPNPQCMQSTFATLKDSQGNTEGGDPFNAAIGEYGFVEVVNDPGYTWALVSMGFEWLAAEGKIWVGPCGTVPINNDGTVNWESFPW